jgi:hypothetical protein
LIANSIGTVAKYDIGLYSSIGWESGRFISKVPWYRQNVRPILQDILGAERDEFPIKQMSILEQYQMNH